MVDNIAATAHIALTEDERQRLAAEFDPIIDSLAVTADEQLPVTVNPLPVNNKVRADVVANELSNEQALSAAPESQDGQFMLPALLDGEYCILHNCPLAKWRQSFAQAKPRLSNSYRRTWMLPRPRLSILTL